MNTEVHLMHAINEETTYYRAFRLRRATESVPARKTLHNHYYLPQAREAAGSGATIALLRAPTPNASTSDTRPHSLNGSGCTRYTRASEIEAGRTCVRAPPTRRGKYEAFTAEINPSFVPQKKI